MLANKSNLRPYSVFIKSFILLITVVCSLRCSQRDHVSEDLKITMIGESLIRFDPRIYIENPSQEVNAILQKSDLVFTNLEGTVCVDSNECKPTRMEVRDGRVYTSHVVPPQALDYLKSINIKLLSLSNNHSWDFGDYGVLSTLEAVHKKGFVYAGTGRNIAQASAPSYITIKNKKIALISTSAASKFRQEALATDQKPGVNIVDMSNDEDRASVLNSLEEALKVTDLVIIYQHLQGLGTVAQQEQWARELIDHGATIFISHGEHQLGGIELYKGGIIFYNLGGFIFHTRYPIGHYGREMWQSVIANIDYSQGRIRSVEIIPVVMEEGHEGPLFLETRGMPELADHETGNEILTRLSEMSSKYNTKLKTKDNKAFITFD